MELTNEEIQEQQINKVLSENCGYENVKEWLLGMGLGQYYNVFIENGYDSLRVCSEIQKIDIETIGILDRVHINILTKGLTKMNNSKAQSVYHRLSIATPDGNEFRSLANELDITPSPLAEYGQTNGFHYPKLTENFYKKKPTLADKRSVRTQLIQLSVNLSDYKYADGSSSLDELAEEISQQLNIEALSVYDILCLMRGTALENISTKPNKQPSVNSISNGDVPAASSPEEVFQENNSSLSPPPNPPKAHMRPKKPPRSMTNLEEKPLLSSLTNGDSTQPASTHSIPTNPIMSAPEPDYCAYDILHSDSSEPQIMTNVKSPVKQVNKPEDTPPAVSSVTSENLKEETLYIELGGSDSFTENVIQKPKPTSGISKKTRSNTKKNQEEIIKRPTNQPPPPPPTNSAQEVDSSVGKSKINKLIKRESKSHITEDTVNNLTTTTTTTTNENKSKKPTSFFRRNVKPKAEAKGRHKKSKDESDLIGSLKDVEESQARKRMSTKLSKSSDNLFTLILSQECNEENNLKSNQENLPSTQKTDSQKRSFITHIPDLIPFQTNGDDPSQSLQSLPPNPIPRRRNSPEEILIRQISNPLPQLNSESRAQPPKKPKRNITEDIVYDNVEQIIPNPIPRGKKVDSPSLPRKLDLPPHRSCTVISRPMSQVSTDIKQPTIMGRNISCNSLARVKPEVPKGKKPVLKAKPAVEATQIKRDKLVGENQQRSKDTNAENVMIRTTSPLTAPPFPTTKRPGTPSNSSQPPEPPPIHLIPSTRPIAHIRPTKPPIITSANISSPIAEPRNVDTWRKIEDKIWSILKEEDFLDYLITHYTKENGESGITPGLVCRIATETSFAIHHIASALDNIRITRLKELGRNFVPISLIQFDEMETPTHVDNISTWLTSIGLPNYIQVFHENLKDPKEIKNIDADDLSEFSINSKHRGCLLHAIDMIQ